MRRVSTRVHHTSVFVRAANFLPLLIMFSVVLSSHLLFAVAFKHIKEKNSHEKESLRPRSG